MTRLLPLIILVAACGKTDDRPPSPAPAVARSAKLDHATQADLAREIADAERLGSWRELQQRWQGQEVRWTVTRHRALCGAADSCNVAAFPLQRPARQGWMPLLAFAPGQYDLLAATCGAQDPCEVAIEGRVSELEGSSELPTRLTLSNVRIAPAGSATQTARR